MSYRAYVPRALGRDEMKEKNRNAPIGLKYCNAICQGFLEKMQFSGQQVICNRCRNMIHLGEKKIENNEITIEQFIENPWIVYGMVVDARKMCETCKNEKSIMAFEDEKKDCRECRTIALSKQHHANLDQTLSEIEQLKTNLVDLERYLKFLSKDVIILIMTHYKTGRTSADVKSTMIVKILNHFRNLLSPNLCQAGCGATVVIEHSICLRCTNKPIVSSAEKRQTFMDNLDQMMAELKVMEKRDMERFKKDELTMIAKKFGLDFTQTTPKSEIFDRINEILIAREESRILENLFIEEFCTRARHHDGYINVQRFCQWGNKDFHEWLQLEQTIGFIELMKTVTDLPVSILIDTSTPDEIWMHPDLAVQIALWISPRFFIKMSRRIRDIICQS